MEAALSQFLKSYELLFGLLVGVAHQQVAQHR